MKNTGKNIASWDRNKPLAGTGAFLLAVLLTCCFVNLPAQVRDGRSLVRAELVTGTREAGMPFMVGIHFTIEPEWYLYWKNPGDAGLPVEVQWDLPEGWSAGEVRFPVPSKFDHGGIIAYGYKKEIVLLAEVKPGKALGPIKAKLDWLVCRESCLRGGTTVSLDPSAATTEERTRGESLVSRFRSRLPGTQNQSGVLMERAELRQEGETWSVSVRFKGEKADEVTDFFPELNDKILTEFRSITIQNRTMNLRFLREEKISDTVELRGLLVTRDGAFEYSIPLHFSSQ